MRPIVTHDAKVRQNSTETKVISRRKMKILGKIHETNFTIGNATAKS